MKLPLQVAALALPCLLAPLLARSVDTFNAVTDQLTLDAVEFNPGVAGNAMTFFGMVVTPGTVRYIAGGLPDNTVDYLYPGVFGGAPILDAMTVVDGPATYINVSATIASVASFGSVTGADYYDGKYLYLPTVRAGNMTYNFVVVTVAGVDGVAGGLPTDTQDTYTASSRSLSIPAVQYGGRAYTNVTATVGSVVSVNGSQGISGPDSSACFNPVYYATGTTMDLLYASFELNTVVLPPSSFNGVANAVGMQVTQIIGQTTSVYNEYYDITSQFPVLLDLGFTDTGTQTEAYVPGIQFGGAISYGQSLQTSGVTELTVGPPGTYTTNYVFEGFQDITVPAGTFKGACVWRLDEDFGNGPNSFLVYTSRQGVKLNGLLPGSTFNGEPVAFN